MRRSRGLPGTRDFFFNLYVVFFKIGWLVDGFGMVMQW